MNPNLNERQFTLYRGERGHDKPSFYPKSGPDARAGMWWTDDPTTARHYAGRAPDAQVYTVDVHPHEAEPSGAKGNYLIRDPAVRARRRLAP